MLFVVRHGERCDLVTDPVEKARVAVACDSPLTANGLLMAERTGAKIKELLQGDVTNIRIISSPFARCLETSQQIAVSFPAVDRIYVDYQACEFLNPHWYEVDPFEELMVLHSPAYQATLTLPLEFLPAAKPPFPEVWNQMISRYTAHAADTLASARTQNSKAIVVTHGYYADAFCSQYGDYTEYADFCALSHAVCEGETTRLVLAKSCDHIRALYRSP